jgi:hypothetical protein
MFESGYCKFGSKPAQTSAVAPATCGARATPAYGCPLWTRARLGRLHTPIMPYAAPSRATAACQWARLGHAPRCAGAPVSVRACRPLAGPRGLKASRSVLVRVVPCTRGKNAKPQRCAAVPLSAAVGLGRRRRGLPFPFARAASSCSSPSLPPR